MTVTIRKIAFAITAAALLASWPADAHLSECDGDDVLAKLVDDGRREGGGRPALSLEYVNDRPEGSQTRIRLYGGVVAEWSYDWGGARYVYALEDAVVLGCNSVLLMDEDRENPLVVVWDPDGVIWASLLRTFHAKEAGA